MCINLNFLQKKVPPKGRTGIYFKTVIYNLETNLVNFDLRFDALLS